MKAVRSFQPLSTIEFPWRPSTSPSVSPSFWSRSSGPGSALLRRRLSPTLAHAFPQSATNAVHTALTHLAAAYPLNSLPNTTHSLESPLFHRNLALKFNTGFTTLQSRNLIPALSIDSNTISLKVVDAHWTYGSISSFQSSDKPNAAVSQWKKQQWGRAVTLHVPNKDAVFENLDQQKRVFDAAVASGCVMTVSATVDGLFEFSVMNAVTRECEYKDVKRKVCVRLESGHLGKDDADFAWKIVAIE
ncbi:hypothetical protein HDU80_000664 [Chytriomyces hyalinus]|nr:hypothetical protein HDU80_000664 [Chytriomyces hyalinus]